MNRLYDAVLRGDPHEVRDALTSCDAANLDDVNVEGETSLMCAVRIRNLTIVRLLLSRGANPNVADRHGNTALMLVAQPNCAEDIMECLLENGALPRHADQIGRTALHQAATNCLRGVEILLKAGADPNVRTNDQETPLSFAIVWQQHEISKALIAAGADPTLRDSHGWEPLTYAVQEGIVETVRMLLQAGADAAQEDGNGESIILKAVTAGVPAVVAALLIAPAPPSVQQVVHAEEVARHRNSGELTSLLHQFLEAPP